MSQVVQIESRDPAQTVAVGFTVARACRAGDVVALVGELGAGKTQFVRGMATGLGLEPRVVRSPTFVIVHEYGPAADQMPLLVHIDAYRLPGPAEFLDLAWDPDLRCDAVVAVEWADRVRPALGDDLLEVGLEFIDTGRSVRIEPKGGWISRMEKLRHDLETLERVPRNG